MAKEQERDELHRTIWQIANDLRGSVDGWDFKSYVLGMFYAVVGVEVGQCAKPTNDRDVKDNLITTFP